MSASERTDKAKGCVDFACWDCNSQREIAMPLHSIFQNAAFDADATRLMGCAFDRAKAHLAATPPEVVQECMANHIIKAAHAGERDVKRLSAAALNGLIGAFE